MSAKTIVFIHGLFTNGNCWEPWVNFFQEKGYTCVVPDYPFHEGEPSKLRRNMNKGLENVEVKDLIEHYQKIIEALNEKPILIGHSMGGLIVQLLINRDLASKGICVHSAPPKGVISFAWSFLKANIPIINPLKGDALFLPSLKWFHYAFCNTMTLEEAQIFYDKIVVPEGRNIPRSGAGKQGEIDFKKSHVPLLFWAGEKDTTIPSSLNRKNANAYKDRNSIVDFKEFPDRTHIVIEQKGWEEVVEFIADWL